MEDRCKLCWRRREEDSEYCLYHQKAYSNLKEAYRNWKKALNVEWNEFLKEISEKQESGKWSREVAVNLLKG